MVTFPSAEQLGMKIPSDGGSVVSIPQDASRGALGDLGGGLQQIGEGLYRQDLQEQQKLNALQEAKAETMFLQQNNEFLQGLSDRNDYQNFDKEYQNFNKGLMSQAAGMITDPYQKQLFEANLQRSALGVQSKVQAIKRDKWHNAEQQNFFEQKNYLEQAAATADPQDLNNLVIGFDNLTGALADNGILTPQQADNYRRDFSVNAFTGRVLTKAQSDPYGALADLGAGEQPQSDVSSLVTRLLKREGVTDESAGFVADDAGAGPTIFGINSKANPLAYDRIKKLYDEGDKEGAQNAAREYYKTAYYDEIGGDSLDSSLREVALDAAVNMGVGTANRLLGMSDGDPVKFTELRKAEYQAIAKRNPSKAKFLNGWLERADRSLADTVGTGKPAMNIPLSENLKLRGQIEKQVQTGIMNELSILSANGQLGDFDSVWSRFENSDLPTGVKAKIAEKLLSLEKRQRGQETAESKAKAAAINVATLAGEINLGDTPQEIVKNLRDVTGLRDQEIVSIFNANDAVLKEKERQVKMQADFNNPYSDGHANAVNKLFPTQIFSDPNIPTEQKIGGVVEYTKRAGGMIAEPIKKALSVNLKSADPQGLQFAGDAYGALKLSGGDVSGLTEDTRAFGEVYETYIGSGMKPADAALRAYDISLNPASVKVNKEMFARRKRELQSDGSDIFTEYGAKSAWFGRGDIFNDLPVGDASYTELRNDFEQKFERYYGMTRDEEAAADMARSDMSKVWDYSDIDDRGEQLHKYPPDKAFGLKSPETIKRFMETIKQTEAKREPSLAGAQYYLVPDHASASKGKNRYVIQRMTDKGIEYVKQGGKIFYLDDNSVEGLRSFERGLVLEETQRKLDMEKRSFNPAPIGGF